MPTKHPKPARVRPKINLHQTLEEKLEQSQGYLHGQASADPQNKLGAEAAALTAARTTLESTRQKKASLQAQLDVAQAELVVASDGHDQAMRDYATAAAKLANGDASVLATYGVEAAAKPAKAISGEVSAPAQLSVEPGAKPGEVRVACSRVARAGAYEFQYKLEPSQASDPWLPGTMTKHVTATLADFAVGQRLRVRARAIGNAPGPWSADETGSAR